MKKYLFIFAFIVKAHATESWCIDNPVKIETRLGERIIYDKSCALVISASEYEKYGNSWEDLPNEEEANKLSEALKNNGFSVKRIKNASSSNLLKSIKQFAEEVGTDNSRLIIYFSGHGDTDNKLVGYIVPEDAPSSDVDKREFIDKSISTEQIIEISRKSKAKHLLFVFDSCFSGALFKTKSKALTMRSIPSELLFEDFNRKSRGFLSSTDDKSTSPAKSEFTPKLIEGINGAAISPNLKIVTGKSLALWLKSSVSSRVPQFGDIDSDGGDMVFIPSGFKGEFVILKSQNNHPKGPDVIYYRKLKDENIIINALDNAGVSFVTTRNNKNPDKFKTNTIACYAGGDVEPVKEISKALINSGVEIMEIQSFESLNKPKNRIELLSSAKYYFGVSKPLSLEQIEGLKECPKSLSNKILPFNKRS